ncbi:D-cysteine desulfhydrase [Spartinivicinus poritis]|uniref:D-cysteine desulfhydrase n=1 Tax=Spartinivicinus poritis TaxID=2994640 RepID=A0ABT5UCC2_9GAMM|nr:D-cysteine desulfhydrase [Spartinivicinus sp. A2-2]MDE1464017.1 D-cysteine desulfhydrase [Spartinivicinus sp. A2-2]
MNYKNYPRRHYLQYPTPIEHLPQLSNYLGCGVEIFVKRDDLLPGAAGGNKTRKLEFLVADALKEGADTLITCGSMQSNHCRLTASWAVKEGLDCHLILKSGSESSYKEDNTSGNYFLNKLLGAKIGDIVHANSDLDSLMIDKADLLKQEGKRPYIIPIGGSNSIGTIGYVACAEETIAQLRAMKLDINHIVIPSGSAGTQAGIIAGMTHINDNIQVHGINVSRKKIEQENLVLNLANETAGKLGYSDKIPKDFVTCYDEYVGEGYAIPTKEMIETVKLFARLEGLLLDPVYSGKAAAGMLDLIKQGKFKKGSKILFFHTGGVPALYSYMNCWK